MVVRQGPDVLARLKMLTREEHVPSASVSGFGFVAPERFGFFDFERGDYDPRDVEGVGIVNFAGSLARVDGRPSIHARASGGDRKFRVGGRVLALIVGRASFGITVTVPADRLHRRIDPDIGARVLTLSRRGCVMRPANLQAAAESCQGGLLHCSPGMIRRGQAASSQTARLAPSARR